MAKREWRRALWVSIALAILAPPIASLALRSGPDLLHGAVRSIPEPQ
jgi:hypothetical protein